MTAAPDLSTALAPVRDALLRAARNEATRALSDAEKQARDTISTARRQAEAARAGARAAGLGDAERAFAAARLSHQREARTAVLRARHAAYQQLHAQVRAAAAEFASGPDYPPLRATLVELARQLLAPDAEIVEAPGGGIVARSGSRSLDLSLTGFADRAADRVAVRLVDT